MGARRTLLGVLLLAALLVVGCGGNRSTAERAMDAKFDRIDVQIASLETITSAYNIHHLSTATERYIALVREYANQLGRGEVKRRLKEKGDELGPYCLPCVATLESEATKY